MKKFVKVMSLALVVALGVFALVACGNKDEKKPEENQGEEEDLGFTEVEIFSDVQKEFLNLNAVYFQPVDMTGGYKHEDYDCHLELDVSALENDFGYGKGDWVPYLSVDYKVEKGNDVVAEGAFMPMAASDGPHYGQNIKLAGNGTYKVTFTIKFPDSSVYLIHTDETGPKKSTFPDAIVYTYDAWNFQEGAWNE